MNLKMALSLADMKDSPEEGFMISKSFLTVSIYRGTTLGWHINWLYVQVFEKMSSKQT